MSQDIVNKLWDAAPLARAIETNTTNGLEDSWPLKNLLLIAADEIQLLRQRLAETQRQVEYWQGKAANP